MCKHELGGASRWRLSEGIVIGGFFFWHVSREMTRSIRLCERLSRRNARAIARLSTLLHGICPTNLCQIL